MANWRTTIQDDEILNVARFKLGETARRLSVLAESAMDPRVRVMLTELSTALSSEQRTLGRLLEGCPPTDAREPSPLRRAG